jgi:hypothetical protein
MNLVRVLRLLIAAEIGFIVLATGAGVWSSDILPEQLQAYLSAESSHAWSSADSLKALIFVPILGLFVAGWIGLWTMKTWSRAVYTMGWGFGLLSLPLLGPSVTHRLEHTLGEIATLAAGMLLSLIWFSPLAERFRPTRPNPSSTAERAEAPGD